MTRGAFAALLALVLVAPRAARLAHPEVWDEDGFALASARLLARGAEPYRDFDAPYLPAAEGALALAFRAFGPTLRVAEIATQVAHAATALLLGLAARRAFGRVAGLGAAAVFGGSHLVFRYHLFEHESFVALALAGAFALCASGPPRSDGRRLALGLCLGAALLAKPTALASVASVVAWQFAATRDRRATAIVAAVALAPAAALAAALAWRYGAEFWLQTVGLHLVKGSNGGIVDRARFLLFETDLSLAAGACGGLAALRAPRGSLASLAVYVGAAEAAAALVATRTLWAHNLLPLLVPAGILGGAALAKAMAAWRRPRASGIALVALFLALAVNAGRHARRVATPGHEAFYGFGFTPRAELDALAREIGAACPEGKTIDGASPLFGFAAGRDPAVPFEEFRGVLADLREAVAKEGFLGAVRSRRERSFWRTIGAGFPAYADALAECARRGEVGAIAFEPAEAARRARALRDRGVRLALDPVPEPGPSGPRAYRVTTEREEPR